MEFIPATNLRSFGNSRPLAIFPGNRRDVERLGGWFGYSLPVNCYRIHDGIGPFRPTTIVQKRYGMTSGEISLASPVIEDDNAWVIVLSIWFSDETENAR